MNDILLTNKQNNQHHYVIRYDTTEEFNVEQTKRTKK